MEEDTVLQPAGSAVPSITVEFFGIPRHRAGTTALTAEACSLGELLRKLESRYPNLNACLENGRLRQGYTANINGERFVADPATELKQGDAILILSADAGG
jgi:molybdopterin converting factor small subunit